jgi:hypothetical protein
MFFERQTEEVERSRMQAKAKKMPAGFLDAKKETNLAAQLATRMIR